MNNILPIVGIVAFISLALLGVKAENNAMTLIPAIIAGTIFIGLLLNLKEKNNEEKR